MAIEINGIELNTVHRIQTLENGGYVQQQVPGLEGDITQNMGRHSLQLQIDGIFYGEEIEKDLKGLREVYLKREPVEFLAQITGQAYAAKVLIDSLRVLESGEANDQYTYQMVVLEYIEPPSAGGMDAGIDELASLEAMEIVDIMELPDLLALGSIPEISNPLEPLKGVLTPVQEASAAFMEVSKGLSLLFSSSSDEAP